MKTIQAFANGEADHGNNIMIFDWDKAARLIRERKPKSASAGLNGDWSYTGGEIYRDGVMIHDNYCYLGSMWATPILVMDGDEVECYRMQSDTLGWSAKTKWPESARLIMKVPEGIGNTPPRDGIPSNQ